MPRGELTKDIFKCEVLKIKQELENDSDVWLSDPKTVAHRYLNKVLNKIDEYRV